MKQTASQHQLITKKTQDLVSPPPYKPRERQRNPTITHYDNSNLPGKKVIQSGQKSMKSLKKIVISLNEDKKKQQPPSGAKKEPEQQQPQVPPPYMSYRSGSSSVAPAEN
jgi:hypothetical protein